MFDAEHPNHPAANQPIGKEAGLDYTVNTTANRPMQSANQQTINYLVHRMLWDQQEKIDLGNLDLGFGGTPEAQDKLE